MPLFVVFVYLLVISCVLCDVSNSVIHSLDVNSPKAVKAAEFAVFELSKLSDSEVYTSLSLNKINYAAEQDGIFHFNTLLSLELSSPHFKSKKTSEEFKMIVMVHKEDGVKALAIDEFPVMDEEAIEEFYILKIEKRRKQREESFRRLEIEARLHETANPILDINNVKTRENFSGKTVEEVLALLDTPEQRARRQRDSQESIQLRLGAPQLAEEQQVVGYSLRELYEIITGRMTATDYQIYRARTLLDASMATLPL